MNLHHPSGGLSPASGLFAFLPQATTPQAFKEALGDEIERMIAMLDHLDGDADLEPSLAGISGAGDDLEGDDADLELSGDENEPSLGSLGSCGSTYGLAQTWAGGDDRDREQEDGNLEPDVDDEPSLGAPDRMLNQANWGRVAPMAATFVDAERDDSDREDGGDIELNGDETDCNLAGSANDRELDDSDREPSLGSISPHEDLDQTTWADGNQCGADEEQGVPPVRVRRTERLGSGHHLRPACVVAHGGHLFQVRTVA